MIEVVDNQDISILVDSFLKHGVFEEEIWNKYAIAKVSLVNLGSACLELLFPLYQNSKDGNVSIYLTQIMGEIGDAKALPYLNNWAKYFSSYAFYSRLSEYSRIALIDIAIRNGEFQEFINEINDNSIKKVTQYFCPTSKQEQVKAIITKKLFIKRKKEIIPFIIECLNARHLQISESILVYITEMASEICDSSLIMPLEKFLVRKDISGFTRRQSAIALTKMGRVTGYNELKRMILSDSFPWDVKLKTLEEMYILGLGDVFEIDEKINLPENYAKDIFFVAFKWLFDCMSKVKNQ